MNLLFDIGNTSIGVALANDFSILKTYSMKTDVTKTADEYFIIIKNLIDLKEITDILITSVVPRITKVIQEIATKFFNIKPFLVVPGVKTGLKIKADNPKEAGSDLICDALGLNSSKATLIIDLGTATKYIYVSDNTLLGLIICPGVLISIKALVGSTALLPDIDILVPKNVLGNSTKDSMQSGVTYGIASQIDGLIERIKEEVPNDFEIIATGGLASLIIPLCKEKIQIDSNLVFKGLLKIYNRNKE